MKQLLPFLSLILISTMAFGCSNDALTNALTANNKGGHVAGVPQKFPESEELGEVRWYRDLDTALAVSEATGKDVLILFQEVPGCATCRNYGHNVLTHPLMVEAIENEFVPLAIFNNKQGKDLQTLRRYDEPTWNNPVVRFVDRQGENITRRIAGDYEASTLAKRMKTLLEERGKVVPEYLNLLIEELDSKGSEEDAYYSMSCFWSGERALGKVDGVLETRSGFMNGREVVKVTFDANQIDKETLSESVEDHGCAPVEGKFRESKRDVHYYLRTSNMRFIPMTELQKTKVNSALGQRKDATQYLSPQQMQWWRDGLQETSMIDEDISEVWWGIKE